MADGSMTAAEAATLIDAILPADRAAPVILAVSGGADSTALLVLAGEARRHFPTLSLHCVTVDHGLRPEGATEARCVATLAESFDIPHTTCRWQRERAGGNLSAAARDGRYALLADTALRLGAASVLTAHHLDDQVETHLLALERGGPPHVLAGMRASRALVPGVALCRPFLAVRAARLRASLAARGIAWADDPTNSNMAYARARLRRSLAEKGDCMAAALPAIATATAHRAERDAIISRAMRDMVAGDALCVTGTGGIAMTVEALQRLCADARRAVVGRAVAAAGGGAVPPDRGAVERLLTGLGTSPGKATLGGATIAWAEGRVAFAREYGRTGIGSIFLGGDGPVFFDRRFMVWPRPGNLPGTLRGLGVLGLGNAATRSLPVLMAGSGGVVAAHPDAAARLGGGVEHLDLREAVSWRLMADLAMNTENCGSP